MLLLCKFLDFYKIPYAISNENVRKLYESKLPLALFDNIIVPKGKIMDLIRTVFYDKSLISEQLIRLIEEAVQELAEYIYFHSSFLNPYALFRLKNIGSAGRYGLLRNNTFLPRLEDVVIKIKYTILFLKNVYLKFIDIPHVKNNILISISAINDFYLHISKQSGIFHSDHFLEDFFRDYSLRLDYAASERTNIVIKLQKRLLQSQPTPWPLFERLSIAAMLTLSVIFYYHTQN